MVEHLAKIYKALSSIPVPAPKKKKSEEIKLINLIKVKWIYNLISKYLNMMRGFYDYVWLAIWE